MSDCHVSLTVEEINAVLGLLEYHMRARVMDSQGTTDEEYHQYASVNRKLYPFLKADLVRPSRSVQEGLVQQ